MPASTTMPLVFASQASARREWKFHPVLFQLIALGPVLWWFCKRLNDGSDEPLGLLTLALAAVLAWKDRKCLHPGKAARVIGAALIFLSAVGIHGMPPMVRALLAVAGLSMSHGLYRRPGLTGLLMLSLPLAASMQFYLGYPMRLAAAEGAVRLLELCNLVVFRKGVQLELGGMIIGVDPACGGVRMLWHALAAAMGLATVHRLRWRAAIIASVLAILLVIPANAVRAALLAVKESGHLPGMFLGHEAIGLLAFAVILVPLWFAIVTRARQSYAECQPQMPGRWEKGLLIGAAILAPVLAFATPMTPEGPLPEKGTGLFTFENLSLPLEPLPQTETERAFAKSFPGTLGSYGWGGEQVVLRKVSSSTRRLHASLDCLRAAGFQTTEASTVKLSDGTVWAKFHANREGVRLTVHERIVSERNGASWTDVSAWYWASLMNPLNGPWLAETVISER